MYTPKFCIVQSIVAALLFLCSSLVLAEKDDTAKHDATLVNVMHFNGTINNKQQVEADITLRGNEVSGYYRYSGDNGERGKLKGKRNGKYLEIDIYNWVSNIGEENKVTNNCSGTFDGYRIKGVCFNSTRSESHQVRLTSLANINAPYWRIKTDAIKCQEPYTRKICVTKVKLIDAKSNNTVQVLRGFTDAIFPSAMMDENQIILEDMNFDGYPDIRLTKDSSYVNVPYFYWLYSSDLRKFVRNEELEDYALDPEFNLRERKVLTHTRNGYQPVTSTYVYEDGKYVLTKRVEVWWDDKGNDHVTVTRYKAVNGKSVEIDKKSK